MIESSLASAEAVVMEGVQWLKLGVEVGGATVIGLGVVAALRTWVTAARARVDAFGAARLTLARFLALALELELGADILSTAISPTWDQIGKLAAIAVIRTVLNYFLQRELRGEAKRPDVAAA
jgi:uncharacterized membrane protein